MSLLCLAGPLAVAAHDLDLVCKDRLLLIIQLKNSILDEKRPNLVTETIRVEIALGAERMLAV